MPTTDPTPITRAECLDRHKVLSREIEEMFAGLERSLTAIKGDTARLDARLYRDNGAPSIQTRLDRLERRSSNVQWWKTTLITAIVAAVAGAVVSLSFTVGSLIWKGQGDESSAHQSSHPVEQRSE